MCKIPDTYCKLPVTGNVVCDQLLSAVNRCDIASNLSMSEEMSQWLASVEGVLIDKVQHDDVSFAAHHTHVSNRAVIAVCANKQLLILLFNASQLQV